MDEPTDPTPTGETDGGSDRSSDGETEREPADPKAPVAGAIEAIGEHATAGRDSAQRTERTIEEIAVAASEVRETVRELDDLAESIGEIADVISDVADQTRILALNANIEAARVGEGNEGFVVVAEEVKTLAAQSRARTDEIEAVVDTIETNTDRAVESLETVNRKISEGMGASHTTTRWLDAIEDELAELEAADRDAADDGR